MKLNIFELPIWIGNIDCSLIKINTEKFQLTWESETPSSFHTKNEVAPESAEYIAKTLAGILNKHFNSKFLIKLKNIWVNQYNDDYQEPHIHTDCNFSFIIYNDVQEAKTVFNHPLKNLIHAFKMTDLFPDIFQPECRANQIIVFPSFYEHWVKRTNQGTTIAGNFDLEIK